VTLHVLDQRQDARSVGFELGPRYAPKQAQERIDVGRRGRQLVGRRQQRGDGFAVIRRRGRGRRAVKQAGDVGALRNLRLSGARGQGDSVLGRQAD
jgi:hypothetical protein